MASLWPSTYPISLGIQITRSLDNQRGYLRSTVQIVKLCMASILLIISNTLVSIWIFLPVGISEKRGIGEVGDMIAMLTADTRRCLRAVFVTPVTSPVARLPAPFF